MKKVFSLSILVVVVQLTVVAIAEAQERKNVPKIGFLGNSTAALEANLVGPFREGLRDFGYIEQFRFSTR
jgi:hypothetical protein